jgi:hypothetical protein
MTIFLESPIPVISIGIVAEAVLATILVSTRKGWALWSMLGVLLLVFAGVALEIAVVTDVEKVEATLDGVTDALEANDLDRLLKEYVSPNAVRTRNRATNALRLVEITSAKVSNLSVTINRLTSPPTARAEFLGTVRYEPRDPERIPYKYYGARFIAELRWEGDRWKVTDHVEYREL